ncbi:MAG: hypothetical protein M3R54_12280, partial [Chloroflexota bacterium]|nr:hypothetical protein [Chloroflexota bacterium]
GYIAAHWPPSDEPELERSAQVAGALGAVLAKRASPLPSAVRSGARLDAGANSGWSRAAREDALR